MRRFTIATIKDVKEIEFLSGKSSFNYTYDKTAVDLLKKHFLLKDSLYLIAKKSTEFAAFCSIDKDWWGEHLFFIREIFVDPKFQKLGIGKTMIGKCIEHAKDKKAIGIVTETDFKNTPMKNLCEKFNFKKWDNPRWKEGITYKLIF